MTYIIVSIYKQDSLFLIKFEKTYIPKFNMMIWASPANSIFPAIDLFYSIHLMEPKPFCESNVNRLTSLHLLIECEIDYDMKQIAYQMMSVSALMNSQLIPHQSVGTYTKIVEKGKILTWSLPCDYFTYSRILAGQMGIEEMLNRMTNDENGELYDYDNIMHTFTSTCTMSDILRLVNEVSVANNKIIDSRFYFNGSIRMHMYKSPEFDGTLLSDLEEA